MKAPGQERKWAKNYFENYFKNMTSLPNKNVEFDEILSKLR